MKNFQPATLKSLLWQLSLLFLMIAYAGLPTWFGTRIEVQVRGMDPRDLFRGNYVALNYDFENLDEGDFPSHTPEELLQVQRGNPVYVRMEKQQNSLWESTEAFLKKPESGLFLLGKITSTYHSYPTTDPEVREVVVHADFGLNRWFDQKPKALELERERDRLIAEISVLSGGRSSLSGIRVQSDSSEF